MACPPELCFLQQGVDAGEVSAAQDFRIWYLVLPFYPEQSAEAGHVEVVELSCMSTVDSPGFTAIQKSCDDHRTIDLQLSGEADSSALPDIVFQSAES